MRHHVDNGIDGRQRMTGLRGSLLAAGGVYGFGNFRSIVGGRLAEEDKFGEAPPVYFSAPERPFYPKILRFNAVWPSCVIARTEDLEFTLRCNQSVATVIQYRPLTSRRRSGRATITRSPRNTPIFSPPRSLGAAGWRWKLPSPSVTRERCVPWLRYSEATSTRQGSWSRRCCAGRASSRAVRRARSSGPRRSASCRRGPG
jgi:hypothetical protein